MKKSRDEATKKREAGSGGGGGGKSGTTGGGGGGAVNIKKRQKKYQDAVEKKVKKIVASVMEAEKVEVTKIDALLMLHSSLEGLRSQKLVLFQLRTLLLHLLTKLPRKKKLKKQLKQIRLLLSYCPSYPVLKLQRKP